MSENVLSTLMARDMAVDLGTANTVVYVRGRGIVLDEPSVVAVNVRDGRPLAVGLEAKRMIGRTPAHIQAIRPLKDGVIADFEICEKMLRYFIQKVNASRWVKPRMVICVPSGVTGVEKRAVQEAAVFAGARKEPFIIEEPMAAAIGAGLPVHEPSGNMIVDIGGGTTEVAVISLGGIVASQSVRIGGDELDEAIINFIKKEYSLALGERTAEEVKITLGSAWPLVEELHAEIRGRDLITGLPKTIVTSTEEIREALEEPVSAVVDAVKVTLDKTPPELAADIMEKGIVLAGGGAMLHGLDARLQHETGMPIVVAHDPLHCVAIGGGQTLEEFDVLKNVLSQPSSQRPLVPRRWRCPGARRASVARASRCCLLVLTSITVLTLDFRGAGVVDDLRGAATTVFSPVADAASAVTEPFTDAWNGAFGYDDLERENERLREQIADMEGDVARADDANRQLAELAELEGITNYTTLPSVTARVVGGGLTNFEHAIQIDRGSDDGIVVGMPVVTGAGLVGRVATVTGNRSTVQLRQRPGLRPRRAPRHLAARSASATAPAKAGRSSSTPASR